MKVLDGYVRSPLAGIAPWILMSVVNGPGRFEEAAAAALGLAVLTLWVSTRRGVRVHLLEGFTAVYFGVLAIVALVAPTDIVDWLHLWAGEVSNIALALFAVVTLAIKRPFTLAYAKDTTPPEHWDSPVFLRINYVISSAWAAAFVFSAVVGAYGDAVLADNDNFWTSWILPIGAVIFAVSFTEFYPDRATGEAVSWARAFDWLPPFVVVVGIAGWVSDALPDVPAISLIVVGVVASALLRRFFPSDDVPGGETTGGRSFEQRSVGGEP
jgi:hypothetical protein